MTWLETLAISFFRSCGVTLAATILLGTFSYRSFKGRNLLEKGLFAIWLIPGLILAYGWSPVAVWPVLWRELVLISLLVVKVLPSGWIFSQLVPPPSPNAQAIHIARLCPRNRRSLVPLGYQLALSHLVSRWRFPAAFMFILAFQEFELPALLRSPAWTDWLFMRLASGEPIQGLWPCCALAAFVQLPMFVAVYQLMQPQYRTQQVPGDHANEQPTPFIAVLLRLVLVTLVLAALGGVVWRLAELPAGMEHLLRSSRRIVGLTREISSALCLAAIAVAGGQLALRGILSLPCGPRLRLLIEKIVLVTMLALGALGEHCLGMLFLSGFQTPLLSPLYDTFVPLSLALTVWLLPKIFLFQLMIQRWCGTSAMHVSQLLKQSPHRSQSQQGSALDWQSRGQYEWRCWGVLTYLAYMNCALAGQLSPSQLPSGVVRLYNFMHYGHSASLTAEACLFAAAPVVLWLLLDGLLKWCWNSKIP